MAIAEAVPAQLGGQDLATERRIRRLTAREVAAAMGVKRQRVTNIEALEHVPAATAQRYSAAVARAWEAKQRG